jgi:hypothetical protein
MGRWHRRSTINASMQPRIPHAVCQDLENKPEPETDKRRWARQRPCHNAPHPVVTRPSTHTWPTTRSRPSVGTWSARKVDATSGGLALMRRVPPGSGHGLHDPSTPPPERQHTSYGPSCPCTRQYATTARAVTRRPSYTGSPSKGSSRYPHDALYIVFCAATARRCKNTGLVLNAGPACRARRDHTVEVVNDARVLLLTRA